MSMIKKLLGMTLSASLLFSSLPLTTLAVDDEVVPESEVSYKDTVSENGYYITDTDIKADSVTNYDGYGSIYIEHLGSGFADFPIPGVGMIDKDGNTIIGTKESQLDLFYYDGVISLTDNSYHHFDTRDIPEYPTYYSADGKSLFKSDYFTGSAMRNGYAVVTRNFSEADLTIDVYIVNSKGEKVYTFDGDFKTVLTPVYGGDFMTGIITKDTAIMSSDNGWIECFSREIGEGSWDTRLTKLWFQDVKGNKKLTLPIEKYNDCWGFKNGYAAVKSAETGKFGWINEKGEEVIPCVYEDFFSEGAFADGMAAVMKDGKWGFINLNNETVIPFEYELTVGAYEGLATVKKDGRFGLIDYEGNTVISFDYDHMSTYRNGVAYAVKNGKVSIISADESGYTDPGELLNGSGEAMDQQPCIDGGTTELTLVKGQKFVLSDKSWKSSDKSVISVKKGKVSVKKGGKTATLSRDGQTVNVTVIQPAFEKSCKMIAGEEKPIPVTGNEGLPVLYVSDSPDVAVVDQEGTVRAVGKGSTYVSAYVNGVQLKCKVSVAEADTSKKDFSKIVELKPMQTVAIKVSGLNAKKAAWTSETMHAQPPKGAIFEDDVVRISKAGKITAIGAGETVLSAEGSSGPVTIQVSVSAPEERTLHMNLKDKKTIKLYGVKGAVNFTSEDPTIASADKNKITANAVGETTLTAEYENFTYSFKVYVEDYSISDTSFSGKSGNYSIKMKAGETKAFEFNKSYQPVELKSNKCSVAYIDEEGVIHARSKGTAKCSAKINGKTVKLTITVTE